MRFAGIPAVSTAYAAVQERLGMALNVFNMLSKISTVRQDIFTRMAVALIMFV